MKVVINGKTEHIAEGTSVKELLESKDINMNVVACELNLQVIRRKELGNAYLKDGDTLEIIRMIGGG